MSKLKPLSKDEDLVAIPVDEPVLVELPGAVSGEEEEKPTQRAAKPEKVPSVEREEKPDAEAGVTALQKQMADMQRASADREARLARERDEARREADEARTQASETEADLVQNGLAAAQSEEKAARAALKAARDTGDTDAEADAVGRLGRAAADIRDFERAAATIAERPKQEPRRTTEPQTDINATIDAMQLLPAEKDWLRSHPDALSNPNQRLRLDAAYLDAMDERLVRGSAEYLEFMDKRLGYAKPAAREDNRGEERTVVPAAPVSRDSRSVSGKTTVPTRIELSPAERQQARDMGITDTAYARGKQQMLQEKQLYPEKFAQRA